MTNKASGKRISLVLGSGGARGLAHIGVIHELEARGYTIASIAGSSMGALIGGIYAMGKLQEYEDWVCALKRQDILGLLDWNFSGDGLLKGETLISRLGSLLGECDIEDLDIDFTAVAVDLDKGKEIWLDRGSLFDAIRASIAIPGIFTPHKLMGLNLVDGGLLNPVPVAATLRNVSDLVIAVDANAEAEHDVHQSAMDNELQDIRPADKTFWQKLGFGKNRKDNKSRNIPYIMMRSLEVIQAQTTRQGLSLYAPDLLIGIPHDICMIHEFEKASAIIAFGRKRTRLALDAIEQGHEHSV